MTITETLKRELRQALRGMVRSPGFTLIVLVTLALGIGATTAIFTMLDRIVLHPLLYAESSQLVWIDSPVPGVKPDAKFGLSVAEFFYLKKNAHTLQNMGTYMTPMVTVAGTQSADRVPAAVVSASAPDVLGLHPSLGRALSPADNRPHAAPVAVLGYEYWQQHYNGDPRVVGSIINVQATPTQIVGVMQPGATVPEAASPQVDMWLPLTLDPNAKPDDSHYLQVIARLAPGATVTSAHAELARFTNQLPNLFPTIYSPSFVKTTGFTTEVLPLRTHVIGDIASRLWVLLGAVAFVLVIACANVANLFLARTEARHREVAIRSALGAKRADLAWHYLTESMLLTLIAGVAALALAFVGLRAMVALAPPELPRLAEVHLGWPSVLFTVVISMVAGLLFGVLALAGAGDPAEDAMSLREGGRGLTSSRRQQFARGALVAAQTALALVLLAGAGLMLQSFRNLRNVSPGFTPAGVLTASVNLPRARYHTYEQVEAFYHELLARAAAIPGVTVAGAASDIPLDGFGGCSGVWTEDHPLQSGEEPPCVGTFSAAPGYFRTLGIRVRGQEPNWGDVERRSGDVVVTKALAERLWPGQNAIGKGIKGRGPKPPFYHVVGVTEEIRGTALDEPPLEGVFFPMIPIPGSGLWGPHGTMAVVLRSSGVPPETLTGPLRKILTNMDPNVPLADVRTMDAVVAKSMTRLSFTMMLLGIAAAIALILSAVGIYGVIAYIVGRRTGEIGIRMALGARASRVGRLVVWQSLRLTAVGVVIGIVGALAMTRVLRSVLFDVSPTDPLTLLSVSAIMLIIAALASYVPAQRAMRVDPAEALRAE